MTGRFSTATAVCQDGGGRYTAEVARGWDIAGNTNGGYLLAIAARALGLATARRDPVSMTGHYLSPGKPGTASIEVDVLKEGRRFATGTAVLSIQDRHILAVIGTFGDLSDSGGPEQVQGGAPELPDPQDCVGLEATDTFPPPFMGQVELRLHPEDAGFAVGRPSGTPRVRGWFRLRDDEPVDTTALLCAVDAFPPTAFNANLPVAWTPTVELTAHIRARPAPGWLACCFTTRFVTGGFLEADGEVWDRTGKLVAQSRQLALIPRG